MLPCSSTLFAASPEVITGKGGRSHIPVRSGFPFANRGIAPFVGDGVFPAVGVFSSGYGYIMEIRGIGIPAFAKEALCATVSSGNAFCALVGTGITTYGFPDCVSVR